MEPHITKHLCKITLSELTPVSFPWRDTTYFVRLINDASPGLCLIKWYFLSNAPPATHTRSFHAYCIPCTLNQESCNSQETQRVALTLLFHGCLTDTGDGKCSIPFPHFDFTKFQLILRTLYFIDHFESPVMFKETLFCLS